MLKSHQKSLGRPLPGRRHYLVNYISHKVVSNSNHTDFKVRKEVYRTFLIIRVMFCNEMHPDLGNSKLL